MTRPSKSVSLKRLQGVLDRVPWLRGRRRDSPDFEKWLRDTQVAIGNTFGKDHLHEFERISFRVSTAGMTDSEKQDQYIAGLSLAEVIIQSMIDEIAEYWGDQETDTQEEQAPPRTREIFIVHGPGCRHEG